jgi:exfoliative toxin A/B
MKGLIKNIPMASAGLMLGLAAAGNLIQSFGSGYRLVLGSIAAVFFILLTLKLVIFKEAAAKELGNPVVASVFPTYSMALMLLSVYLKPWTAGGAIALWILALALHIAMIALFSKKYLAKFSPDLVFPSWYIVYVGIVAASVTSPAFAMKAAGRIVFWFGLISYLILAVIIIKRLTGGKPVPDPARPTIAILCAPASLLLAGYMNSFDSRSISMVIFLLIVSQLTYLYVLSRLPKLLSLPFYPSYSAFTFPMVISAISVKSAAVYLGESGYSVSILKTSAGLETLIAILLVIYVLARYTMFLIPGNKPVVNNTTV